MVNGLVGVAALQWTYFVAIDRLPVGMALLLEYQAPILVALWARFVQRERVRPRLWVGLALAWAGLAAATGIWRGLTFDVVGVLGGLGAAVCFATYFLIGEHGVDRLDPLRVILWSFLIATVGLNVVHPLTGTAPTSSATGSACSAGSPTTRRRSGRCWPGSSWSARCCRSGWRSSRSGTCPPPR